MTTNQTIDGVPRELLERIFNHLFVKPALKESDCKELRALLDAPTVESELSRMTRRCQNAELALKVQTENYEALKASQPQGEPVASLEIVGRQCFPSEAMKAVQGYRKEPWVDGDVGQLPSELGFYRIEPLVRLSDVANVVFADGPAEHPAPVAVVLPVRADARNGSHDHQSGWNACLDEVTRLNSKSP